MRLADLQRRVRDAVVSGNGEPLLTLLERPDERDPASRLDIYLRHFETSLVEAVMNRFPATGWLLGSPALERAARAFVRAHPPAAPCIAEYGSGVPAWLEMAEPRPGIPARVFAEFDWHLGRLAVGVSAPALPVEAVQALGDALPGCSLTLQPATWYGTARSPIDTLMTRFLSGREEGGAPLEDEPVWIEARGDRGRVWFTRLAPGAFAFRQGVQRGLSLEAAAAAAVVHPDFQPGPALAALFHDGLVTGVSPLTGAHR
ncbi:MAG: putative DNA-binding domain-containing protein [Vicinamibacterales bacterium]